jgi:hypothetical protein
VSVGGAYSVLLGDLYVENFDGFSPYSEQYPSEREFQVLEIQRIEKMLADENMNIGINHLDIDPKVASILNKYALRTMTHTPLKFAKKVAIQTLTFWYLGNTRAKTLAILFIQLVFIIPWLIAGTVFCISRRVALSVPLLLMILYLNLIYAVTNANARHGMPVMPLAMIVVAYGLSELVASLRRKPAREDAHSES